MIFEWKSWGKSSQQSFFSNVSPQSHYYILLAFEYWNSNVSPHCHLTPQPHPHGYTRRMTDPYRQQAHVDTCAGKDWSLCTHVVPCVWLQSLRSLLSCACRSPRIKKWAQTWEEPLVAASAWPSCSPPPLGSGCRLLAPQTLRLPSRRRAWGRCWSRWTRRSARGTTRLRSPLCAVRRGVTADSGPLAPPGRFVLHPPGLRSWSWRRRVLRSCFLVPIRTISNSQPAVMCEFWASFWWLVDFFTTNGIRNHLQKP